MAKLRTDFSSIPEDQRQGRDQHVRFQRVQAIERKAAKETFAENIGFARRNPNLSAVAELGTNLLRGVSQGGFNILSLVSDAAGDKAAQIRGRQQGVTEVAQTAFLEREGVEREGLAELAPKVASAIGSTLPAIAGGVAAAGTKVATTALNTSIFATSLGGAFQQEIASGASGGEAIAAALPAAFIETGVTHGMNKMGLGGVENLGKNGATVQRILRRTYTRMAADPRVMNKLRVAASEIGLVGKAGIKQAAGEAFEEGIIEPLTQPVLRAIEAASVKDLTSEEFVDRLVDSTLESAQMGAILGTGFSAARIRVGKDEFATFNKSKEVLDQIRDGGGIVVPPGGFGAAEAALAVPDGLEGASVTLGDLNPQQIYQAIEAGQFQNLVINEAAKTVRLNLFQMEKSFTKRAVKDEVIVTAAETVADFLQEGNVLGAMNHLREVARTSVANRKGPKSTQTKRALALEKIDQLEKALAKTFSDPGRAVMKDSVLKAIPALRRVREAITTPIKEDALVTEQAPAEDQLAAVEAPAVEAAADIAIDDSVPAPRGPISERLFNEETLDDTQRDTLLGNLEKGIKRTLAKTSATVRRKGNRIQIGLGNRFTVAVGLATSEESLQAATNNTTAAGNFFASITASARGAAIFRREKITKAAWLSMTPTQRRAFMKKHNLQASAHVINRTNKKSFPISEDGLIFMMLTDAESIAQAESTFKEEYAHLVMANFYTDAELASIAKHISYDASGDLRNDAAFLEQAFEAFQARTAEALRAPSLVEKLWRKLVTFIQRVTGIRAKNPDVADAAFGRLFGAEITQRPAQDVTESTSPVTRARAEREAKADVKHAKAEAKAAGQVRRAQDASEQAVASTRGAQAKQTTDVLRQNKSQLERLKAQFDDAGNSLRTRTSVLRDAAELLDQDPSLRDFAMTELLNDTLALPSTLQEQNFDSNETFQAAIDQAATKAFKDGVRLINSGIRSDRTRLQADINDINAKQADFRAQKEAGRTQRRAEAAAAERDNPNFATRINPRADENLSEGFATSDPVARQLEANVREKFLGQEQFTREEMTASGQAYIDEQGGSTAAFKEIELSFRKTGSLARDQVFAMNILGDQKGAIFQSAVTRQSGVVAEQSFRIATEVLRLRTLMASEAGRLLGGFKTETTANKADDFILEATRLTKKETVRVDSLRKQGKTEEADALQKSMETAHMDALRARLAKLGINLDDIDIGQFDSPLFASRIGFQAELAREGERHPLVRYTTKVGRIATDLISPTVLGFGTIARIGTASIPVMMWELGKLAGEPALGMVPGVRKIIPELLSAGEAGKTALSIIGSLTKLPADMWTTFLHGASSTLSDIRGQTAQEARTEEEIEFGRRSELESIFGKKGIAFSGFGTIGRALGAIDQMVQRPGMELLRHRILFQTANRMGARGSSQAEIKAFLDRNIDPRTADPDFTDMLEGRIRDLSANRKFDNRTFLGSTLGGIEKALNTEVMGVQGLRLLIPVYRGVLRGGEQAFRASPILSVLALGRDMKALQAAKNRGDEDIVQRQSRVVDQTLAVVLSHAIGGLLVGLLDDDEQEALKQGQLGDFDLSRVPFAGQVLVAYGTFAQAVAQGDIGAIEGAANELVDASRYDSDPFRSIERILSARGSVVSNTIDSIFDIPTRFMSGEHAAVRDTYQALNIGPTTLTGVTTTKDKKKIDRFMKDWYER